MINSLARYSGRGRGEGDFGRRAIVVILKHPHPNPLPEYRARGPEADMLERPGTNRTFRGDHLLQIAMPMGGIGAGSICLNGHGGLQDFSIRHKPAITALPDGFRATD